ncbi:MAG: AbrB/MazE/SpoVT family DNA-binding domain-containing protein [Candidatus Korobacteraceae bacterium]
MRTPFTTRISSRGQIVIPSPVRKALALEPGTTFLVIARKDTIVLHRLQEPPWQFFDDMVRQARKQGRQHDAAMQGFAKVMKKLRYGR